MKGWPAAVLRVVREDEPERFESSEDVDVHARPALPPPRRETRLVVTDHLSLLSVDCAPHVGAVLRVIPITRVDAMEMAQAGNAILTGGHDRHMGTFERELQIDAPRPPKLSSSARYLVCETVRWNDVRWFLVEYLSDGDGVVE